MGLKKVSYLYKWFKVFNVILNDFISLTKTFTIHATRLCTHYSVRIDAIKAMSRSISGDKQAIKFPIQVIAVDVCREDIAKVATTSKKVTVITSTNDLPLSSLR